jgi:hypothetical protein
LPAGVTQSTIISERKHHYKETASCLAGNSDKMDNTTESDLDELRIRFTFLLTLGGILVAALLVIALISLGWNLPSEILPSSAFLRP